MTIRIKNHRAGWLAVIIIVYLLLQNVFLTTRVRLLEEQVYELSVLTQDAIKAFCQVNNKEYIIYNPITGGRRKNH